MMAKTDEAVSMMGDASAVSRRLPGEISVRELFLGFLKIGLMGFGGCAAVARHVIVEDRAWLTEQEYASLLALGQVIPGGNLINLTVMLGDRYQGVWGAVAALAGFTAMPLLIMVSLALLVERFSGLAAMKSVIVGTATVAAGLTLGTAFKILWKLRLSWVALLFSATAFVAVGMLQFSLILVVVVLAPISIAVAFRYRRS